MEPLSKYVSIEVSCECGTVEHFDDLDDNGDNITWTCEDCGEDLELEYLGATARCIGPPVEDEAAAPS